MCFLGSSGSEQSEKERVNTQPDDISESKVVKSPAQSIGDLTSEGVTENDPNMSKPIFAQKVPKRKGTIDVWWLYDDGGNL